MSARLARANSAFVLGRGPGFAIACESALKFKETSGIHAEAYSAAEVRGGTLLTCNTGDTVLLSNVYDFI